MIRASDTTTRQRPIRGARLAGGGCVALLVAALQLVAMPAAADCNAQCRQAHNQCRIATKGAPSCDSQFAQCLRSCMASGPGKARLGGPEAEPPRSRQGWWPARRLPAEASSDGGRQVSRLPYFYGNAGRPWQR